MICEKCGEEIPENETVCPKCGAENAGQEISIKPRGFSSKTNIIIIVTAALLALGAGGAAIAFGASGKSSAHVARYMDVAERYLSDLNYEQAVIEFQNILEIEPRSVDTYLSLSRAYGYIGDYDSAKDILNKGIEVTGSSALKNELYDLEHSFKNTDTDPAGRTDTVKIGNNVYPADARELVIRNCGLTSADLSDIGKFTQLERLDISGNEITDLSALSNVKTLKKLFAAGNKITDVSPLSGLPELTYVGLRGNQVDNVSPLFTSGKIKYLHLSDNRITVLPDLPESLKLLYISGNNISDTSPIQSAAGLLYCDID